MSSRFGVLVPGGHGGFVNGMAKAKGQMGNASYPTAAGNMTVNTWSYGIDFGGGQSHPIMNPYIIVNYEVIAG